MLSPRCRSMTTSPSSGSENEPSIGREQRSVTKAAAKPNWCDGAPTIAAVPVRGLLSACSFCAPKRLATPCVQAPTRTASGRLEHPARHRLVIVERARDRHVRLDVVKARGLKRPVGGDVEGVWFAEQSLQLENLEVERRGLAHEDVAEARAAPVRFDDVQVHERLLAAHEPVRSRETDRLAVELPGDQQRRSGAARLVVLGYVVLPPLPAPGQPRRIDADQ